MARILNKISNTKIALILGTIFFVFVFITLPRYGINWDTINHLPRGQAYLNYFLTGLHDYSNLPKFEPYFQRPDVLTSDSTSTRSLYQNDAVTFDWLMQYDGYGHPPLSDILASASNRIFFGQLHLVNDIDSYRLYAVFLASLLVGLCFYWISKHYGRLAGFVTTMSLASYPLFWSEVHFNTEKDVPETALWSFFLFFVYQSITLRKKRLLLVAGFIGGMALGTKFNILFAIIVAAIWGFIYFATSLKFTKMNRRKSISVVISFLPPILGALVIGVLVFILTWPFLWQDLYLNLKNVFIFYKDIGTAKNPDPAYISLLGINSYAIQWIIYTTPPIVLIMSFFGSIRAVKNIFRKKDYLALLFLLWFLVPIARASAPGTSIYGGVRQLMEYIPAMCFFAGLGAVFLYEEIKSRLTSRFALPVCIALVLLGFSPTIIKLIKIHPNENVYFNFILGGLGEAKKRNLHAWGNTFGAAYRQAVVWINENSELDSHVVTAYELLPNIPSIWFRSDIVFHNQFRSGYLKQGEYAITLTYDAFENRSYYDQYLERFLIPVYESRVDDVAVVKVWKNSEEYLKLKEKEIKLNNLEVNTSPGSVEFILPRKAKLSRLEMELSDDNCKELHNASVSIEDEKGVLTNLPGTLPDDWRITALGTQPSNSKFIEPFVGQESKRIKISGAPIEACLFRPKSYSLYIFDY